VLMNGNEIVLGRRGRPRREVQGAVGGVRFGRHRLFGPAFKDAKKRIDLGS